MLEVAEDWLYASPVFRQEPRIARASAAPRARGGRLSLSGGTPPAAAAGNQRKGASAAVVALVLAAAGVRGGRPHPYAGLAPAGLSRALRAATAAITPVRRVGSINGANLGEWLVATATSPLSKSAARPPKNQ